MDRSDRKSKKERKRPRIPIKTYRWEDVRRSRKKGGYPWTHLYKHPFNEELDVEPYTMDGMRKAKSWSTVGRSDGERSDYGKSDLEISELSDMEGSVRSGEVPEKMDTLQIVSEPDNHSSKNSGSSVNIEEIEASDKDEHNRENVIDSAESWDNISQYLDKEENAPTNPKSQEAEDVSMPETSKENDINKKIDEKNEEATKRKRKLSAESSYSRISQTKLAIMKKLNETKNKIKVPKMTFSVSKLKKPKAIPKKQKNSPPEKKKEIKKSATQSAKNSKPVYIHIPLKPPSGQTDEFSYLEFGEKKETKEPTKKPGSFRDLVKNMKQLQEQNPTDDKKGKASKKLKIEESINEETGESITPEENKENIETATEGDKTDDDNKTSEEAKAFFKKCGNYRMSVDEASSTDNQQKEDETTEKKDEDIFEHLFQASTSKPPQEVTKTSTRKNIRSKSAEPEGRKRKLSMESSYSRKSLSKLTFLKKLKEASEKIKSTLSRSNSKKKPKAKDEETKKLEEEEPKKEEKTKKLKEEKPKKEEKTKKLKEEEPKKEENKTKQLKASKPIQPVYIHIPLKPPEGHTDEFSYLEHTEKPAEPEKPTPTPPTPPSPPSQDSPVRKEGGVQFIILTAPSDDELLDYNSSDVCDTPSSENKLFFANKITEMKQIAKDVVDELQGSKKLESVEEECNGEEDRKSLSSEKLESVSKAVDENSESSEKNVDLKEITTDKPVEETSKEVVKESSEELKSKTEEAPEQPKTKEIEEITTIAESQEQKMMVDEEDGLNESKPIKQEESNIENNDEKTEPLDSTDLKSSLKTGSPVIKKKVSFKRRSKTPKDGSYEDIQAPDLQLDISKKEETDDDRTEQTISIIGKVIGDTSLEDDKWSKISDHEYEPVNPPPDNIETFPNVPPQVYVIDTDYDSSILPLGSVSFESTVPTLENIPKNNKEIKIETVTIKKQPDNSNSASTSVSSTKKQTSASSDKSKEGPSKFQLAFQQKKENLKNKFHNMKKPHITMPERPKFTKPDFKKFKIEKPKLNFPKIPDTTKISLPHFSLQRKHSGKRSLKERQLSTESNDGDSKKPIFDFSTYPRIFRKKSKAKQDDAGASDFATVPRTKKSEKTQKESSSKWSGSDSIRIPLHSEDSMETGNEPTNGTYIQYRDDEPELDEKYEEDERIDDSPIRHDESSRIRYEEDIDIDDDYEGENEELHRERDFLTRWDHGRFNEDFNEEYLQNLKNSNYKVTDLDSPEDIAEVGYDYNSNEQNKDQYSSGSSFGQRRGVMEEINSDEFFWRPKGISQDDIHISMNISSEIREAFRTPTNALTQIENDYKFNDRGSQQSLPEAPPKRKPIKKPKRKKTPHTSQERIPRTEESADDDLDLSPPSRPKRRSKRKKKDKTDDFIPYRETISIDKNPAGEDRLNDHRESLGVLGDDEQDEEIAMYENERMEGKDQPEITVTDPYSHFEFADEEQEVMVERPAAPPRKQKSMKSLNLSENDSILEDFSSTRALSGDTSFMKEILEPEIQAIRTESKVIIPIDQELPPIPTAPKRPSRIRADSRSRGTSQGDEGSLSRGTSQIDEQSIERIDLDVEDVQIPCVEEPCIQDIRDPMGYAIIDKTKVRDPPLPPPRTLTRQKRSHKIDKGNKFNTVPRSSNEVPVRPLRNYSTLGQTKKTFGSSEFEIDKENIDITQYIEIEDEPNKKLQSGEVIQKMKDRPLPAPPRPPRKGRPLRDITSQENIMSEFLDDDELDKLKLEEIEVSTQTEPLPDDFVCEEVVQEPSDRVIMPSTSSYEKTEDTSSEQTTQIAQQSEQNVPKVEKHVTTPTFYPYEETITHGSLLVEPLNGAKILPESEIIRVSREIIIPITRESEDDTSSIPEEFHRFSDPTNIQKSLPRHSPLPSRELEVLKAQKLQVADLDVDQLRVNQLTASKIVVSEIDSGSIHTDEIGSKAGALTVGEINLPPSVIDQIIKSIRSSSETLKDEKPEALSGVQKKTSTSEKPREILQIETLIEEIMEVEERPCTIIKEITEPIKKSSSLENLESQIISKDSEPSSSLLNIDSEDNSVMNADHLVPQENIIHIEYLDENPDPLLSQQPNILEHEDQSDQNIESIPPIANLLDQAETLDVNFESPQNEEEHPQSIEQNIPPIPPPRSTSESVVIQHQIIDETTQAIPQSYTFEDQAQAESQSSSDMPPRPPPRSTDSENLEMPPIRPPREKHRRGSISTLEESIQEPEVDDEPPPRPPDPQMEYIPSQPPASFYALRAQKYVDENIPAAPRRRRHRRSRPRSRSISSSENDSSVSRRPQRRSSEPSIVQLSSQLVRAASTEVNNSFKRLIDYIMNNVLGNADGKQDLNVMILIVLVLIAGLILLGHDDERTVVHLHHWEYFNPPRDL